MEKAGFKTCTVCGKEFELTAEEHYVAREDTQTGLRASLGGEESKLYDAMDCPYCGSQMLLNRRLRETCPCDYGICDECGDYEEDEEDEPSVEEMREYLETFCKNHRCSEDSCPLCTKAFKCGRGTWFPDFDEDTIRAAYAVARGKG